MNELDDNFRSTDEKPDCLSCKFFLSYQDEYEDELEPHYCGTCRNPKRHGKDHYADIASEGHICDFIELTLKKEI